MCYASERVVDVVLDGVTKALWQRDVEPYQEDVYTDDAGDWHYEVLGWRDGDWMAYLSCTHDTVRHPEGSPGLATPNRGATYRYLTKTKREV